VSSIASQLPQTGEWTSSDQDPWGDGRGSIIFGGGGFIRSNDHQTRVIGKFLAPMVVAAASKAASFAERATAGDPNRYPHYEVMPGFAMNEQTKLKQNKRPVVTAAAGNSSTVSVERSTGSSPELINSDVGQIIHNVTTSSTSAQPLKVSRVTYSKEGTSADTLTRLDVDGNIKACGVGALPPNNSKNSSRGPSVVLFWNTLFGSVHGYVRARTSQFFYHETISH
jgi:hypothetical protein